MIPPIHIAIVEDEMIIASDMEDMLLELGYTVSGIATSYAEGLELTQQETLPDLFLLDITLNGFKNGIDLAYELQRLRIPHIFITSHEDHTMISRAKETLPYGYLIKPFTKQDLYAAIEMAVSHLHQTRKPNSMFLPFGRGKQKIGLTDILFIKASGNYVEIRTKTQRIALRKNLKEFEAKLPANHPFIRVHKSYLVNMHQIVSFNQMEIKLNDETQIPIGRTFLPEVKSLLERL